MRERRERMATKRGSWLWSRREADADGAAAAKRRRTDESLAAVPAGCSGVFKDLPDELVVSIIAGVAASADKPADLAAAMLTCKRFRELGQHQMVYARASPRCIAVRAKGWSDDAHRFLLNCSLAGNINASYLLGMIQFYCLGCRSSGTELMAQAALRGHAEALYSLAIIQFNGSGRHKAERNLYGGAHLCARAAQRGHTDALRELGHCLSDGYGVPKSVSGGRRLLILANLREIRDAFGGNHALAAALGHRDRPEIPRTTLAAALALRAKDRPEEIPRTCLLSDFGCHIAAVAGHSADAANAFLTEWFASRPVGKAPTGEHVLRLCSHHACGRPETRQNEFRRCAVCTVVVYCSRGCQALHWRARHKKECTPVNRWLDAGAALNANINANAGGGAAPNAVHMAMP